MRRSWKRLAAFAAAGALVLLPAAPVHAQAAAAEITGVVADDSGRRLADVIVALAGEGLAGALTTVTGADGAYRLPAVPPGSYRLSFDREGFAGESRGVRVAAGATAVENATLRVARQYSVAVTVDSGTTGVLTNRATVSASTQEGNPGDESAVEDTTVTSRADLVIAASDSVDPVIAGTELTYTVTVVNNGPSDARYVEVTDTLPAGVTFSSTTGCEEDPAGVPICSLGTIPAGGSKRYAVTVAVNSGTTGTIVHQTSVSSQTVEASPGDESTTEDTAVGSRADLAIVSRDSADPVIKGNPLSYLVTVTNDGPSDARGVVVTETLPAEATFTATTGCAEDPSGVPTCSLRTIPAGSSKSFTVAVRVAAEVGGVITHRASVTAETAEASPGDESTTEDTTVEIRSDLAITASDSVDPVIAGNPLTYTLTVVNNGPSEAREVEVESELPAGATFSSTSGCSEDPGGFPSCGLGTILPGASRQLTLVLTVDSGQRGEIALRAGVGSATIESSPGDESVREATAVEARADLVITSRDSVDPVIAGNPLTYTVTVANNGPSDARDVAVAGTLPRGVTFRSTAGCGEDEAPGGGLPTCTLGTITAGGSKQYAISVLVHPDATGVITNRASVTSATREARPGDESTPRDQSSGAAPAATAAAPVPELVELARAWALAWSEQRLEDYLQFYAGDFRPPRGMTLDEWVRERIAGRQWIEVGLSGIETELLGAERAGVSFDQDYRSDTYSDRVRKTLQLVREDGGWRILEERVEE